MKSRPSKSTGPLPVTPVPGMDLRPPTPPPTAPDRSERYLDRELALLAFNRRVLEQAKDPGTPLLERLRFLTISITNLDEFFEIRVAGLKQRVMHDLALADPRGGSPTESLARISEKAHDLVAEQYRVLNQLLRPELEKEGIRVRLRNEWTPVQRAWVREHFDREVLPVLTPVGLDPAHPFPKVLNKSLNFMVSLEGKDAFGRSSRVAVVQAPRVLPRLLAFPREVADAPHDFVLLSSIIRNHAGDLFPGMSVTGCFQFRVTRNSDLWVDEEEIDDLLHALKGTLPRRRYGDAVRLEVESTCPGEMVQFLLEQFDLEPEDLYQVDGNVNVSRLGALCDLVDRTDLKYPPVIPSVPTRLRQSSDIFEEIRRGDILLHHPFESFHPVVELLARAAQDPNVLAIKQTLYRTGAESPLADALLQAAQAGKEVTAVIELRARFDEAANIDLATRLQEVGAKVVYGIVGYKTHAKMLLIVRREGGVLRRYVHTGTGNYHAKTTRAYTDLGLLTCDEEIGRDVHEVFQQLTGLGKVTRLKKLVQSPFNLHQHLIGLIDAEAEQARGGRPARIIAKMNALIDPQTIEALYRAASAGVRIDLIVRGMCTLRPGVAGLSENIRVRSIVGRFLEHSRIIYFEAGGQQIVLCGSADWMPRNFFRRVEVCFPIEPLDLKRRVLEEALLPYVEDNVQAWEMQPDGTYVRASRGPAEPSCAQEWLIARLTGGG